MLDTGIQCRLQDGQSPPLALSLSKGRAAMLPIIPAYSLVIPAPRPVIPAKAGIHRVTRMRLPRT